MLEISIILSGHLLNSYVVTYSLTDWGENFYPGLKVAVQIKTNEWR